MNKKRLDEIRARVEGVATENFHGWKATNIFYFDLYRQDMPDLLTYVDDLEQMIESLNICPSCDAVLLFEKHKKVCKLW